MSKKPTRTICSTYFCCSRPDCKSDIELLLNRDEVNAQGFLETVAEAMKPHGWVTRKPTVQPYAHSQHLCPACVAANEESAA